MEYIVEGVKYILSYEELKNKYIEVCEYNRERFLTNISSILHLSCVICYLKELPSYIIISDEGIIHQLVHILDKTFVEPYEIDKVRKLFKHQCQLV